MFGMAIENDWHWLSREGATIFFSDLSCFKQGWMCVTLRMFYVTIHHLIFIFVLLVESDSNIPKLSYSTLCPNTNTNVQFGWRIEMWNTLDLNIYCSWHSLNFYFHPKMNSSDNEWQRLTSWKSQEVEYLPKQIGN